ncbi:hypothetical protein [Micromonospora haikouensis]|uniref:Uncharacterized protein n=1 Tax=Micromonospora haikouensis TaxID=686309 RepID=A0A0D0VVF1_9ACTN|nr:hypothetical protein [Micromonospora haikouensis]KIR64733.1 hypothetical protein TK50_03690 [Micromonospora haikouensis]
MDTNASDQKPEQHVCTWRMTAGFGDKKFYGCSHAWSDGAICGYVTMDPTERIQVTRYPKVPADSSARDV